MSQWGPDVQPVPSMLVLADLDDTLFEPHGFSVGADARRAFDCLERERVPIVVCSSRTRAELELIHQELGIHQPFICENGAAVFVPRGYFGFYMPEAVDIAGYEVVEVGKPYAEVVALLHHVAVRLGIQVIGFSDMSVEDVAIDCGVPLLQARLAKLREYNEAFRVIDATAGALPRLVKALRTAGLDCTSRGPFHHVGFSCRDIGWRLLRGLYRRAFGGVLTIAFGDRRGAAPLLQHADLPWVVQSSALDETAHVLAAVPTARLSAPDSVGAWAEMILDISGAARRERSSCSP